MIKQHPVYQNYFISDDGKVFSNRQTKSSRLKPMKVYKTRNGYLSVRLATDEGRPARLVHHLVLEAFIGFREEGQQTRHLNGVRDDNKVSNLAWGTPKENCSDTFKHNKARVKAGGKCMNAKVSEGRKLYYKNNPEAAPKGERSVNAKLSDKQALQIISRRSKGENINHLAKKYGVSERSISNIVHRKSYTHLTEKDL